MQRDAPRTMHDRTKRGCALYTHFLCYNPGIGLRPLPWLFLPIFPSVPLTIRLPHLLRSFLLWPQPSLVQTHLLTSFQMLTFNNLRQGSLKRALYFFNLSPQLWLLHPRRNPILSQHPVVVAHQLIAPLLRYFKSTQTPSNLTARVITASS